jgi:NADH-quinone oxidoreductase subunit N
VNFEELVDKLNTNSIESLAQFRPELALCATIVLVLLLRIVGLTSRIDSFYVTMLGALVGLGFAVEPWAQSAGAVQHTELFTGMLVYDGFTVYFRIILLLFAVLFVLFTRLSGIPDRDAAADVYPLVLGATLGMCLMASANHLLMVFMGVEMASVPSYVLAGLLKGRRRSSEAALKYAVYGAGTAGIMLYGISLIGGLLGSFHIPTLAVRLSEVLATETAPTLGADKQLVLMLAGLMVMVGLAFKLSAVPFHFWCPDVFEGASAEVNAFLSVASKAAALALLVRVAIGFGAIPAATHLPQEVALYDVSDSSEAHAEIKKEMDQRETLLGDPHKRVPVQLLEANAFLGPARDYLAKLIAFLAVITCTFGNLAAYGQTNVKRLLAYSTIAHAGYMMMPVAAALALAGNSPAAAESALAALAFYVAVYLFMNLGAFAAIAFLRNELHSEEIADYAGLIHRTPVLVVCFSLILFSLIGLPPLGGFWPKVMVFASLVDAGLLTVLVIGGLNTAISLFYYLRVVKVMTMDAEPKQRLPLAIPFLSSTFLCAITVPVVVLGVWWNGLNEWAQTAARHLLS